MRTTGHGSVAMVNRSLSPRGSALPRQGGGAGRAYDRAGDRPNRGIDVSAIASWLIAAVAAIVVNDAEGASERLLGVVGELAASKCQRPPRTRRSPPPSAR
jgi:hypothetical protein